MDLHSAPHLLLSRRMTVVVVAVVVLALACTVAVLWDLTGTYAVTMISVVWAYSAVGLTALVTAVTNFRTGPATKVSTAAATGVAGFLSVVTAGPLMSLNIAALLVTVPIAVRIFLHRRQRRLRETVEADPELTMARAVGAPVGLRMVVVNAWSRSVYQLSAVPWDDDALPALPTVPITWNRPGNDSHQEHVPDLDQKGNRWVAVVAGPIPVPLADDDRLDFGGKIPCDESGARIALALAVAEDSNGCRWVLNHDALENLRSHDEGRADG
jgi:hypothetical protein